MLVSGDVTCVISISCPFQCSTSHPLCGWDVLGQFRSLQRLKVRFPTARGLSAFQLFISAFMLTSKVICDDTVGAECGSLDAK
ncbi:hypothetical protein F5J12DRAFT_813567 [Pisolithus orientalis]|uniref:uncharacterized protein n=1 Tax=Pisolithus orientalis TaxID=936130 RepID=UPI002225AD11|nr:uncharacterized protein F5J12DRAFT_813567 [Pisolithus orientalis]KAI6019834.1 hypothetical protein F5J12DRAFT_813567 [Pisolithus orientalis]